jgi:sigma-54 dependent transcriptional regulator, acetoin dehydrogenase operon transcriptional activator AcoR
MRNSLVAPHADRVARVVDHVGMADAGAGAIAPLVDVSWRRCLEDFNLDPAREYHPTVLDQGRLTELHAEHDDLVQIARAEMDSLYDQIAGSGYALLLADTEGVILCEKVDPALRKLFGRAGLIVGAEWSERCEGTNGIGTCAAEARAITIHQTDHFRARHGALSCSAAPIHDSAGNLIAVLDASCVNAAGTRESQLHTVALVNTSARLIEKCLFLRRHRSDAMLRFHHRPEFVDLLHDGAIAVGHDGTIVATDTTGLKLLGAENRRDLVGCSIGDVFDTTYDELVATAGSSRRAVWELRDNRFGRRYYASLVGAVTRQARPLPAPAGINRPSSVTAVVSRDAMNLEDLVGDCPQMQRNVRNARRIADSNVSVVIFGPTGAGKEAFAKALHLASNRQKNPFVAVNCAAIPETLIESELFGYTRGAFTGARKEGMRGRILQSSGGTLFLDEIGDMPLMAQTRLLRVLEEMEVTPLGCEVPVKVNLRVMCASHRNLRDMMSRGEFREDLYYRLNGICVELPALAVRGDKEKLIDECLSRESLRDKPVSLDANARARLLAYSWPGNFRELRNCIRSAIAICDGDIVRLSDLPPDIARLNPANQALGISANRTQPQSSQVSLESAERQALIQVIQQHHWNMTLVAEYLKISRNTLYRKIKRHAILINRREGRPDRQ